MEDLTIKLRMDQSQALAESKKFKSDQKKIEEGILSDAEVAEQAKLELVKRANKAKVEAAVDASLKVKGASRSESASIVADAEQVKKAVADAGKAQSAMAGAGFALWQAGLSAALKTVHELGAAFTEAAEKQKAFTKGFTGKRESLAELADLKGVAADNKFTQEFNERRKRTGATHAEQLSVETELMNSGAQFVGAGKGQISQQQMDKVGEAAAKIAVASKIDPAVLGDLAGKAVGYKDYSKYGENASKEAAGDLASTMAILKSGGGNAGQLARETSKVAAVNVNEDPTKGPLRNLQQASKLVSVMTEGFPLGQGEAVNSMVKSLRAFDDKDSGSILKEANILPTDDTISALKKLAPVIKAKVAEGPEGTTGQDVLKTYFKDELAQKAIAVSLNKGVEGGLFDARDKVEKESQGPEAFDKYIAASEGTERVQLRKAEAAKEASVDERGEAKSELQLLREQAEQRLHDRREIDTAKSNFVDTLNTGMTLGLGGTGRDYRIDKEVNAMLAERAPSGSGVAGDTTWNSRELGTMTPEGRDAALQAKMEKIRAAGGDPLAVSTPGSRAVPGGGGPAAEVDADKLDKAADKLSAAADRLGASAEPVPTPTPAPLGGAPPVVDR